MDSAAGNAVTQVLGKIAAGDGQASEELLPLVYDDLRRLAQRYLAAEPSGLTLQATALVHEAYLRLIGDQSMSWDSRGHFFSAAAIAMRRILIERARRNAGPKRGSGRQRLVLSDVAAAADSSPDDLLALDQALHDLERHDPRLGRLVMLRFFAGLGIDDTAKAMALAPRTIRRDWAFARTWLYQRMMGKESADG